MDPELLLVGIASSAGGIPPLMDLLEEAICHRNMAFVIVPHLSREHESQLPSILKKVSKLRIKTIENEMKLEPCHLYVLPPGSYAIVKNSCLHLIPRPEKGPNQSADVLFESLAEYYHENAIGVVLSGAGVGADGSKGLCQIRKHGGHTYAQSPETAEFSQMPELAIQTGCVDTILPPSEIGRELTLVNWASD